MNNSFLHSCARFLNLPSLLTGIGLFGALLFSTPIAAQDIPGAFTDKIFKGSGSIDMLKDISVGELNTYFTETGQLILGVDVNETNSGVESSLSLGVAIKDISLLITTTAGDFTFNDFYTNTTANLLEKGTSNYEEYFTLFGTGGSSNINSGTEDYSIPLLDDVIYMDNISYTGDLLSARVVVDFLETDQNSGGVNESFFDYSGGFEDFAILYEEQGAIIDATAAGVDTASSELTFTSQPLPTAPGAPFPPVEVFAGLGFIFLLRLVHNGKKPKS